MRYRLPLIFTALLAAGQAQAEPLDLVRDGVAAQGGAEALRAITTLVAKADAKHWEPGQSYSVNGEARFLGDTALTVTADVKSGLVRMDWDRAMKYPAVEPLKYSEIFSPAVGAVTDDKGETRAMSGIRVTAERRELLRASPRLLLLALDHPQDVSAAADQELDHKTYPAAAFAAGPWKFVILFDPATKLPVAVRTRDEDNIWGDSNYDLVLGDWKDSGGVKIAHDQSYRLNTIEVQHVTLKDVKVNAAVDPKAFAVPDGVANKSAPAVVPYQWVLRRLFLGRFTDSDAVYFAPGGSFKVVELAPNVQHVQGGGANNLIVNLKDGIAVFDAPTDEGQSRFVIDAAKAKYPGKPIKYLVLTHHHMDHTGGMRAFAAEGASVIVPSPDKGYFERVITAPHGLEPDAQQKAMKPAVVEEVKDTLTIGDGDIAVYNIANPHVDGFLLVHLPKDNVLWVTDLISPRGPITRNAGTEAVGEALRRHGITGATIAGGHGTTVKQADIAGVL